MTIPIPNIWLRIIKISIVLQCNKHRSFLKRQLNSQLKCKTIIQRFISLNQFGVGFNLHLILNTFSTMQNHTFSQQISDRLKKKKLIKDSYEIKFVEILERIKCITEQLVYFQINFKQQYFELVSKPKIKSQTSIVQKQKGLTRLIKSKKIEIESEEKEVNEALLNKKIENERQQISKLRNILQDKLQVRKQKLPKVWKEQNKYEENLQRITDKISIMSDQLKQGKKKEEKLINTFHKNQFQFAIQKQKDQNQINSLFLKKRSTLRNDDQFKNKVTAKMKYIEQTSNSSNIQHFQL